MYFYYFPKGIIKKKPVNCYEIPNAFNIDEDEYTKLIMDLYNTIKRLKQIWIKKNKKKWTNLTISIEKSIFKIEYDYENLLNYPFDSYARHVIWRYNYLKSDLNLFDKKDRRIIEQYNQYTFTTQLPKKDMYLEKMYAEPVKNIVDFEKTLSVEEAIAQSEKEDKPSAKKTHFFKKRRIVEDIIEMEEDDELVNNQILNWKKK